MNRIDKFFSRIESNFIVNVLKSGFAGAVPFLLVGSMSLVITSLPIKGYQTFIKGVCDGQIFRIFDNIYNYTLGSLSIIILITISYYYAKYNGDRERHVFPIVSLISYITFVSMSYETDKMTLSIFNQSWTLTAIIISLLSSWMFDKILVHMCKIKNNEINKISKSELKFFVLIIPAGITIIFFALVGCVLNCVFGSIVMENMFTYLANNVFEGMGRNFGSALIFVLLIQLMWMFGIHGNNVLYEVGTKLFEKGIVINQNLIEQGKVPTEIYSKSFFDTFVNMGGSGVIVCLLIALLIGARNKERRKLAQASVVPVVFNISETLVFGLPIVFNPMLFVPFILSPLIVMTVSAAAMSLGIVPVVSLSVNWTTPVFFSGIMATGSVWGGVLQLVNIGIGVLIYLPFVKLMDNRDKDLIRDNIDRLTSYVTKKECLGQDPQLLSGNKRMNKISGQLLKDLYDAVENKKIALFYQPQVDRENKVIGVEGLFRWNHPVCGFMYPPLAFYLAAADDNLMELELLVIKLACKDLQQLSEKGYKNLKLSVNISTKQLEKQEFYDEVEKLINQYHFGNCTLAFEITERAALSNTDFARGGILKLKSMNIDIIMDDFGMGNSSMTYLQKNNFDYVKLDGELVKDLENNRRSRDIVESICNLSHGLGFKVIAEYVETQQQRDLLKSLGCNIYQGYYYGKAMALDEFQEWYSLFTTV